MAILDRWLFQNMFYSKSEIILSTYTWWSVKFVYLLYKLCISLNKLLINYLYHRINLANTLLAHHMKDSKL